jgi:hypothetical protein
VEGRGTQVHASLCDVIRGQAACNGYKDNSLSFVEEYVGLSTGWAETFMFHKTQLVV